MVSFIAIELPSSDRVFLPRERWQDSLLTRWFIYVRLRSVEIYVHRCVNGMFAKPWKGVVFIKIVLFVCCGKF